MGEGKENRNNIILIIIIIPLIRRIITIRREGNTYNQLSPLFVDVDVVIVVVEIA